MYPPRDDQSAVAPAPRTSRRPLLRALAGAGALGALGFPRLATPASATIPGVDIEYKRCKVAFVSNASALDAIAVYYADRDGERQARYGVAPTTTDPRGYDPLVVEYDADADRTQIQLAEPRGSLVCVVAESGPGRTVRTNPTARCVPAGFNDAPTASFTVSADPTVGDPVTLTSTATDPDSPERLYPAWDLDGDGIFETAGETATVTFETAGETVVQHRVTDDCGVSDTVGGTVVVAPDSSGPLEQVATLTPTEVVAGTRFGVSMAVGGGRLAVGALRGRQVSLYDLGDLSADPTVVPSPSSDGFDGFGRVVAVSGDTLAVGASSDSDAVATGGAVYVFDLGDPAAAPRKLVPDDVENGERFGTAVALSGETLAVGSARGNAQGAVYVYDLRDPSPSPKRLVPTGVVAGDRFGEAVALADGWLAVGAPGEPNSDTGSVYVYDLADLEGEPTTLAPASLFVTAGFGTSVAVADDTLVAGAPYDNGATPGFAYVFDLNDLASDPTRLPLGGARGANVFGRAVAVAGGRIVVGDPLDAAAYVYDLNDLATEPETLAPAALGRSDNFGWAVALSDDTVFVSARDLSLDGEAAVGAVYAFR